MNAVVQTMDAELKLKKAHIRLMRHPETCLYSGIILLGDTQVVDEDDEVPTACTDGINTYYGRVLERADCRGDGGACTA